MVMPFETNAFILIVLEHLLPLFSYLQYTLHAA